MRACVLVVAGALAGASHAARADCEVTAKRLPVTRGAPRSIDGVLDDPVWQHACFARDFAQQQPRFGRPPTHPVEVAVAIDDTTLYVGARMWSRGPDDVDDALTQFDDTNGAERFIVSLDPSHTKRIAYSFALTARGVRSDWIHTDDDEGARDYSWNPVWTGKAQLLADGWSVEMAIPLAQLRLPHEPASSWGIDFDWYVPRRSEDVFWIPVPLDKIGWSSYFGELVDLPPVRPGVHLELLPYVSIRGQASEVPVAYPQARTTGGIEAGLDARLRPTASLAINATVNPDFAQVDADPSFVNLTAYEVQLPELRPFFVENNSILTDPFAQFFYSRRIGGLPLRLPGYEQIQLPEYTRILGAASLGGYLDPATQLAAIAAVSDSATAPAIDDTGQRQTLVVSPLTGWGVARIEHQIGASVVGAIATAVVRAEGDTDLEPILPSTALTGGLDATLRTPDRQWEVLPFLDYSLLFGSAAAIASTEQDSTHFFQRPDQSYLHVDDDAHQLLGWQAGANADRRAGEWRPAVHFYADSPGFDLNDLGGLASADTIHIYASLTRIITTPSEHVFQWDAGLAASDDWDFGGVRRPAVLYPFADVTLSSFWHGGVGWTVNPPGTSDTLTRGGPKMAEGWQSNAWAYAATPSGRQNQLSAQVNVYSSHDYANGVVAATQLTWRPEPQLRLDLQPTLTWLATSRQYVDTVTGDGGGVETYGARYIFGHLDRREASCVLRATWALSPELVMTLYAQPFLSIGRYDHIGELAAAGTDDVRWYVQTSSDPATALRTIVDGGTTFSIPEPNYTLASLRSTAVLRWELRPGSILYVVWQQQRGGVSAPIAQPFHSASPQIITDSGIQTVAVKLSYWFG
ncbi:MAG TPA: DUF5916 domain-containing protein [Kofleriaceae bacterium]|nr:DUF5916 domain-containing protein [Kofleriaceae bacterium]